MKQKNNIHDETTTFHVTQVAIAVWWNSALAWKSAIGTDWAYGVAHAAQLAQMAQLV